jgi:hypothetical protein
VTNRNLTGKTENKIESLKGNDGNDGNDNNAQDVVASEEEGDKGYHQEEYNKAGPLSLGANHSPILYVISIENAAVSPH